MTRNNNNSNDTSPVEEQGQLRKTQNSDIILYTIFDFQKQGFSRITKTIKTLLDSLRLSSKSKTKFKIRDQDFLVLIIIVFIKLFVLMKKSLDKNPDKQNQSDKFVIKVSLQNLFESYVDFIQVFQAQLFIISIFMKMYPDTKTFNKDFQDSLKKHYSYTKKLHSDGLYYNDVEFQSLNNLPDQEQEPDFSLINYEAVKKNILNDTYFHRILDLYHVTSRPKSYDKSISLVMYLVMNLFIQLYLEYTDRLKTKTIKARDLFFTYRDEFTPIFTEELFNMNKNLLRYCCYSDKNVFYNNLKKILPESHFKFFETTNDPKTLNIKILDSNVNLIIELGNYNDFESNNGWNGNGSNDSGLLDKEKNQFKNDSRLVIQKVT